MSNPTDSMRKYAISVNGDTNHLTWEVGIFAASVRAHSLIRMGALTVDICVPSDCLPSGLRVIKSYSQAESPRGRWI